MSATILERVRHSRRLLLLALSLMVTCGVAIASTGYLIHHLDATTTKLKVAAIGSSRDELFLTATVSPSKATGTITFKGKRPKEKSFADLKTVSLKSGVAHWIVPFSPIGLSVEATYNGSKTDASSTSNIVTIISTK